MDNEDVQSEMDNENMESGSNESCNNSVNSGNENQGVISIVNNNITDLTPVLYTNFT